MKFKFKAARRVYARGRRIARALPFAVGGGEGAPAPLLRARRGAGGLLALRAAGRAERRDRRGAALERAKDRQLPQIVRRAQNRPARRDASARGPHRRHEGASVEDSRQADMGLGLQPRLEGSARLLSDDKGQENPLRPAQARVRREAGRRDVRGARPGESRSRARAATRTTTG